MASRVISIGTKFIGCEKARGFSLEAVYSDLRLCSESENSDLEPIFKSSSWRTITWDSYILKKNASSSARFELMILGFPSEKIP